MPEDLAYGKSTLSRGRWLARKCCQQAITRTNIDKYIRHYTVPLVNNLLNNQLRPCMALADHYFYGFKVDDCQKFAANKWTARNIVVTK